MPVFINLDSGGTICCWFGEDSHWYLSPIKNKNTNTSGGYAHSASLHLPHPALPEERWKVANDGTTYVAQPEVTVQAIFATKVTLRTLAGKAFEVDSSQHLHCDEYDPNLDLDFRQLAAAQHPADLSVAVAAGEDQATVVLGRRPRLCLGCIPCGKAAVTTAALLTPWTMVPPPNHATSQPPKEWYSLKDALTTVGGAPWSIVWGQQDELGGEGARATDQPRLQISVV
jgi:hypothetical protein